VIRATRLAVLAAALCACADPFDVARDDDLNHRWAKSYPEWKQIVAERQPPRYSEAQRAVYHYNFGRAAGVTCHFDEAESELLIAYDLDRASHGPTYMSLFELALLNSDQKKYAAAVDYFDRGFEEMERVRGPFGTQPVELAWTLNEYAIALRGAGREADAEATLKRVAELRAQNPMRISVDRTPYGRRCN